MYLRTHYISFKQRPAMAMGFRWKLITLLLSSHQKRLSYQIVFPGAGKMKQGPHGLYL